MSIELKLFLISHHHRHQPLVISTLLDIGLSLEKRFWPTVQRWTDRLAKLLLVLNFPSRCSIVVISGLPPWSTPTTPMRRIKVVTLHTVYMSPHGRVNK